MRSAKSTGAAFRPAPPKAGRAARAGTLGATAVALGLVCLTGCGPDDDPRGSGASSPAAGDPSAAAESSPGTDGDDGKSGKSGGDGGKGKPSFTVGSDGVKSWNAKDLTRNHTTETVRYPMVPPVGGDHAAVWMNCDGDVYTRQLSDVNAVHSLEHGAVWVTYTGAAAPGDVKKLAALVARTPYSLMSPYEGQEAAIMLTAWGKQRTVKSADDPHVNTFFSQFVQGPQTPEPGAPCTGGLSSPTSGTDQAR